MKTLLLRLAAPLQSWGVGSKFDTRTTNREPTKSGVIGLLAAALGRGREAEVSDLISLKFAVRLDQEGQLLRDYHLAHHPQIEARIFPTHRYYLADAVFVVALEGQDEQISELEAALRAPVFPLFLGRRSCPPTTPLVLGVKKQGLLDALRTEPWQASAWYRRLQPNPVRLEVVREVNFGEPHSHLLQDQVQTFNPAYRQYTWRSVVHTLDDVCLANPDARPQATTNHDPLSELAAAEVNQVKA